MLAPAIFLLGFVRNDHRYELELFEVFLLAWMFWNVMVVEYRRGRRQEGDESHNVMFDGCDGDTTWG